MTPLIRTLSGQDIPSALELCRAAGWNQLHQDWERLITCEPDGCLVAEIDDQVVGTITTTRYGTGLAWIGMMLVHERYRRRGVATALMHAGLDYLREQTTACIKLDATPAGRPVYERLGFVPEWSYRRWVREQDQIRNQSSPAIDASVAVLSAAHIELDRLAFTADRSRWLQLLNAGSVLCQRPRGFGMLRAGYLARYLGPVVAESHNVARDIILELLAQSPDKTFWDVPETNSNAVALAESLGFRPVRDLTRMWIGSSCLTGRMDLQYAFSDPGTG